jgi:hypothetical protein
MLLDKLPPNAPTTGESRRRLTLPAPVAAALRAYRNRQAFTGTAEAMERALGTGA